MTPNEIYPIISIIAVIAGVLIARKAGLKRGARAITQQNTGRQRS